jgi:hypothetical protein
MVAPKLRYHQDIAKVTYTDVNWCYFVFVQVNTMLPWFRKRLFLTEMSMYRMVTINKSRFLRFWAWFENFDSKIYFFQFISIFFRKCLFRSNIAYISPSAQIWKIQFFWWFFSKKIFGVKKSKSWKCSSLSVLNKNWIARREDDLMIPFWIWNSFELKMILISHTQKYRLPRYFYQNWLKMAKNMNAFEWYRIKIGLFRIYSERLFRYFDFFRVWFRSGPETVFGFLQVCTRMTFRFNRLNSTGFISSLKIGMKKLKFWARKRSFGSGKRYFGVSRK